MNKRHEVTGQAFIDVRGERKQHIENTTFANCVFRACVVSWEPRLRVADRCLARNVEFISSQVDHCLIGPAILDDVTIDSLDTTDGSCFIYGAAFRHVLIKGDIGRINILPTPPSLTDNDSNWHQKFVEANAAFYKTVDWALDTRAANTHEFSVSGIPVDLIRYDPNTQAIVRRHKTGERWNEIKQACDGTWFYQAIKDLSWFPSIDGVLLVAPAEGRNANRQQFLKAIARLRDLGIADSTD